MGRDCPAAAATGAVMIGEPRREAQEVARSYWTLGSEGCGSGVGQGITRRKRLVQKI